MVALINKYISGEMDCSFDEFLEIFTCEFERRIEQEIYKRLKADDIENIESEIVNDFND